MSVEIKLQKATARKLRLALWVDRQWERISQTLGRWIKRTHQVRILALTAVVGLGIAGLGIADMSRHNTLSAIPGVSLFMLVGLAGLIPTCLWFIAKVINPKRVPRIAGTDNLFLVRLLSEEHRLAPRLAQSHSLVPATVERLLPQIMALWRRADDLQGGAGDDIRHSLVALAGNMPKSPAGVEVALSGLEKMQRETEALIELRELPHRVRLQSAWEAAELEHRLVEDADAEQVRELFPDLAIRLEQERDEARIWGLEDRT